MSEFKGTRGKWFEVDGILIDQNGDLVPSKRNFLASGRLTTEEVFKNDEQYIKGKYNDKLKEHSPELLEMLKELLMDVDEITTPTSMNDTIFRAEQLIKKATEL